MNSSSTVRQGLWLIVLIQEDLVAAKRAILLQSALLG